MLGSLALLAFHFAPTVPNGVCGSGEAPLGTYVVPFASKGFIENRGQWPEQIRFLARSGDVLVRIECGAIVLQRSQRDTLEVTRLEFEGASGCASFEGHERMLATYSFFLGNDPARWHGGVPSFDAVICRDLYPGVDLLLRIGESGLKYDLVLAPGVPTERVVLRCLAPERAQSSPSGELGLHGALGSFFDLPGRSFEMLESGAEHDIACTWTELEPGRYSLSAPDRDPRFALVVDPELLWSTYLGGLGDEFLSVATSDSQGDAYVSGFTRGGQIFPMTPGTFQHPCTDSGEDVFAAKFRGDDGALIYSSVIGGALGTERPWAIATTAQGELTIVGDTHYTTPGSPFPVTPGAFDTWPFAGFRAV